MTVIPFRPKKRFDYIGVKCPVCGDPVIFKTNEPKESIIKNAVLLECYLCGATFSLIIDRKPFLQTFFERISKWFKK